MGPKLRIGAPAKEMVARNYCTHGRTLPMVPGQPASNCYPTRKTQTGCPVSDHAQSADALPTCSSSTTHEDLRDFVAVHRHEWCPQPSHLHAGVGFEGPCSITSSSHHCIDANMSSHRRAHHQNTSVISRDRAYDVWSLGLHRLRNLERSAMCELL